MIEILEINEQEDGSAIVTMDVDAETIELLLNTGFNQILKDQIEREMMKVSDEK